MSPRPQIDHIRRPQILEAASKVIAERGIGATRISDVAARVGGSAASILYWFGSKDQLLGEALSFGEEGFYERLQERLDRLEGPGQRLRLLIEASAEDYDWTLWMELWTRALRDDHTAKTRRELDERWRTEIIREVRDGQRSGEFPNGEDAERIATILASLIDGLAVQATLGDPSVSPALMRDLSLEIAERLLGTELPQLPGPTDPRRGQPVPAKGEHR